ncbi:hypothetical protein Tco_1165376 [Tanacetum coccineum]
MKWGRFEGNLWGAILRLLQNMLVLIDHDGHDYKDLTMSGESVRVSLSSPAVQQLWTLYPGKQTANLF